MRADHAQRRCRSFSCPGLQLDNPRPIPSRRSVFLEVFGEGPRARACGGGVVVRWRAFSSSWVDRILHELL